MLIQGEKSYHLKDHADGQRVVQYEIFARTQKSLHMLQQLNSDIQSLHITVEAIQSSTAQKAVEAFVFVGVYCGRRLKISQVEVRFLTDADFLRTLKRQERSILGCIRTLMSPFQIYSYEFCQACISKAPYTRKF